MTDRPTQVAQASGVRRARTYVPVQRVHQASDDYPIGCSAYQASIHDARYYRGILSNAGNFAGAIKCDIYTMQHEQAEWRRNLDSAETLKYLKVGPRYSFKKKHTLTRPGVRAKRHGCIPSPV